MPPSLRHLRLVPVLTTTLVLAACGSDDDPDQEAARGATASTTAVPTTTAATPALPADPKARLKAVAAALGDVKSLHLDGTATDEDGPGSIVGDLSDAGDAQLELKSAKQNIAFRVLGADTYLRGDEAFWKDSADDAQLASKLAGRWVSISTAAAGLEKELDDLRPSVLAKCVTVNVGTLTDGGTAEVDGKRALVLEDAGDVPGGTPGRLYLAADGPPLPLRIVQTGKSRSGGTKVKGCNDEDDDTSRSDVRLSGFNEPVRVTAPEGALKIPTPGTEGEATT